MIAVLAPHLVTRILDQIILDRVRMVEHAHDLPELEEDLIGVIEEIRRPTDPPAKPIAVHLILAALRTREDEVAEEERALRLAKAVS